MADSGPLYNLCWYALSEGKESHTSLPSVDGLSF